MAVMSKRGQPHFQVHVQPAPPAQNPLMASPWYIKGPLALIALSLAARLLKRVLRGNAGCAESAPAPWDHLFETGPLQQGV